MNVAIRPTKKELAQMTLEQLQEKLLTDISFASMYRSEILERRARESINNHSPTSTAKPLNPPDIRSIIHSTLTRGSLPLEELAKPIVDSGWDFIDPSGSMTSPPYEVKDFLESLIWRRIYYNELVDRAKGKLNTIVDAYGRWYRRYYQD
jgi:hypothetical protein